MSSVDEAAAAIRAGKAIVLPTDTVYGLAVSPYRADHVERLYRLKGRDEGKPIALLAADLEWLFECVPELRGRAGLIARELLPGPYTLVLPNPGRRYRWLTGSRPDAIGVRVPNLPAPAAELLRLVGAVAATSANRSGGPDPRTLDEVPAEVRAGAAALLDAGELAGTPSTVIDFTGGNPRVIRDGVAPAGDAIDRALAAVA